ncbi:fumarylacetoacetate hydrolase family protein [Pseudomonas sp. RIT-PI-S]|uniref:fumarylacetoacetate hydrolase family protein n=1 Tax=Pseudomonas sp. RIT-PI-S TaxID=3035295 RepID=UPI0021DB7A9F|nr:fumarylacetoacetate hydrolase family protein [Pseudomonas sp. RIT-PI-S]
MKLLRVGEAGNERPALVDERGVLRDLSGSMEDLTALELSPVRLAALSALDPAQLPALSGDTRIGPPLADFRRIICVGLNYVDHAREVGLDPPAEPTLFIKGCVPTGAFDPVTLPRGSEKSDWEAELGIVIGTGGLYITEQQAADHIAGYCVVNDLSERAYQMERGGQWTKGKSFPGFAPVGPWIVTSDEAGDIGNKPIWLSVNGRRYQNSNTANLIFNVRQIVAYVSNFFELEPGDLIATGTPAGVGLGHKPPVFLKDGDVIELGIEGLGAQRQRVHAWPK